jgi:hypothetical protein
MEEIGELKMVKTDLCMFDKASKAILKIHNPCSPILEFRRVKENTIILRLDTGGEAAVGRSNIYCLDDNLEFVWYAEMPFNHDGFPNPIIWDKELNEEGTSWNDYVKDNICTLTTSSQKGITVTIDYNTGVIIHSAFTK